MQGNNKQYLNKVSNSIKSFSLIIPLHANVLSHENISESLGTDEIKNKYVDNAEHKFEDRK